MLVLCLFCSLKEKLRDAKRCTVSTRFAVRALALGLREKSPDPTEVRWMRCAMHTRQRWSMTLDISS